MNPNYLLFKMQSKVKLGFSPVRIKLPFEQIILKTGRKMTFSIVCLCVCLLFVYFLSVYLFAYWICVLEYSSLIWRRDHLLKKAAKVRFISMVPLNPATPVVTLDLGLRVSFEWPTQFSHLNCKMYSINTLPGQANNSPMEKNLLSNVIIFLDVKCSNRIQI